MTITMDNINNVHKKRGSWSSKVSVSTVSTTTRPYSNSTGSRRCGTPSSILSSDSDIRFTQKKLSSTIRCWCYILASLLTALLFAAIFVYIAYTYLLPDELTEQTFRGSFRVTSGDAFTEDLANPLSESYKQQTETYSDKLNLLFRHSDFRPSFEGSEILALDGEEALDLIVYFNLHFDPRVQTITESAIINLLLEEINAREYGKVFANITVDPSSLEIRKSDDPITSPPNLLTAVTEDVAVSTSEIPPMRKCYPIELEYCKHLPYNITSYPNILGHHSLKEVRDDIIAFRELIDGECYRLAYDFVCQLLQPYCSVQIEDIEDRMVMPCRSFCRDFIAGCGSRLPERIQKLIDCSRFPEFSGVGSCRPKPGCLQEMQSKTSSNRVCDGVIDCEDLADEKTCAYCPPGFLHCGIGRKCIRVTNKCDGKQDCPDNSDERNCLTLAPSIQKLSHYQAVTPHEFEYHRTGYVAYNERGKYGKLCTENVRKMIKNDSYDTEQNPLLENVATSLCKSLSYKKLKGIKIQRDVENNVPYVQMRDPNAAEISFVRSVCPNKEVLHVTCSHLECGVQAVRETGGIEGLTKMARHGDWPWMVALYKEDVHVCDGTLISPEWVITTASCFQGQPKAEWIAKLGLVRVDAMAPWQQTRRIVGMVKSPVEGSTIAMVKLEEPVSLSDFARPICLPEENYNLTYCNTLGWTRNREQLQRVQIQVTNMDKCENVSIKTVNSLCTESPFPHEDCNEEEFAGSPMICLLPDEKRWSIVGISNWRIACSKNGIGRPRMYDKIASNTEWIRKTISAIT